MSLPEQSVSVAELAVLRYLDGLPCRPLDREHLFRYYQRNGPTNGLSTVSRRGAAGRMWWRLVDKGFILEGWLTPAGHRALEAAGY